MEHPDPERLSKVPVFEGSSEDDLKLLASWLDVEEFSSGQRLTREGASDYAFYILDEGRVHVEHEGQVLEVLESGAAFGEMAFFAPDGRRSADVVPQTPIRVFSMFGTRFREMQASMPAVAARLQDLARDRAQRLEAAGGEG